MLVGHKHVWVKPRPASRQRPAVTPRRLPRHGIVCGRRGRLRLSVRVVQVCQAPVRVEPVLSSMESTWLRGLAFRDHSHDVVADFFGTFGMVDILPAGTNPE